ncbi:MAG: hypothetical protein HIU81_08500 [Acidobacteria bacterium]|nr:hypothetical protein [Acidobacteriota bacterium]
MSTTPENSHEQLRRALSHVISAVDPGLAGRLEQEPDAYLDLIGLTQQSSEQIAVLLQSAVTSARLAGLSWERIGERLGMSRQAAQQRFGRASETVGTHASGPGEKRRLSPVTSFDEMDALAEAGRHGWHSVGFGMYFHDLAHTDEQWEHLRVAAFGASRRGLEAEGWQRIGNMWFPWAYYARPTGKPIETNGDGAETDV